MEQMPLMLACQRWRAGRDSYRPAGEPLNTREYAVDLIEEAAARQFIAAHHYARSLPPARLRVGLFRSRPFRRAELVGCAVYSVPIQQAAVPHYFGIPAALGVELGRLCLLDECEANAETFFVARANRLLHRQLPEVEAVLSYSDPVPRVADDGRITKRGHAGVVYRALSARYMGRSRARTLVLAPDGTVVSERSLSKLRNGETGAAGAYRMLLRYGAPGRRLGEADSDYVRRALEEGPFRRLLHTGCFAFGWPIGSATTRRRVTKSMADGQAYPPYAESAS